MKKRTMTLCAVLLATTSLRAQESATHSLSITTEGLWNTTTGIANWVNLLSSQSDFPLPLELSLNVELLAVNNMRMEQGKSGVADNLHLFSAIEDSPSTLALMTFGLSRTFAEGEFLLFAGIRNLGCDYFTSPWNSVFTSAMNGLFPSISTNFAVADAPNAAMALHAEWHPTQRWSVKMSLYDGVASQMWNELFSVNLRRDGVFAIGEISYAGEDEELLGNYSLGATYGYAPTAATLSRGATSKSSRGSVWMLAEQPVARWASGREVCVMFHGGWAPQSDCDAYGALALLCRSLLREGDYIGLMASRGLYEGGHETQLEVTYSLPYKYGTLQPALHRVFAANGSYTIAMMKLIVEL